MKLTSPEILRHLVRRFGLLALLTLLGGIAGGVYGVVKTPTYVARAYVVVTGQPGEPGVALNFAQAYGRIVTTGPVADKAAATLGSTQDLKLVTAATSPDTPVVEIVATGTNAKHTADVANTVAQALVDVGNGRKDQTRVTLAILASASVPGAPSSPKPPLELVVGAAAGLLLGGLSVLAGVGRSPAVVGDRRVPLPPAIAGPATRAITYYPETPDAQAPYAQTPYAQAPYVQTPYAQAPYAQTPYYGEGHAGEKIVGRAVVLPQDPR
jgi:capsular polysaccharide biosynthesis protein